jgi:hypothetical protein
MSCTQYLKKSAYDDFFAPRIVQKYEKLSIYSTLSISHDNVSIRNSVFFECKYTSHGGAISYSGQRLLIEETTFISCSTSYNYGGAVYATCYKSVLNKICAFECFARRSSYSSYGHAFYISLPNDPIYNNYINYSSISNSKNTDTNSYHAQYVSYGRILLTNENISMNECYYETALYSNGGCAAYVAYCTFANNTAIYYGCLQFDYPHEMHECNILFNEQRGTGRAYIIYSSANLFIWNSCILENNKGKKVFYEGNGECRIALYNCTIDSDIISSQRYYNNLTIHQTNERAFINGNKHLITNLCDASFNAVGTLTAPIEYKGANSGLSLALNRNANGFSLSGMNIAKYLFINSFLSYE